jgi:hypothetical protein
MGHLVGLREHVQYYGNNNSGRTFELLCRRQCGA